MAIRSNPTQNIHNPPVRRLVDRYNRNLDYMRISITDRCNLACIYCVPQKLIKKLPHEEILRYEEILRIVKLGVGLGIRKIRITGGEPLLRKGVYDFLGELVRIDGLCDVSLTTNGIFLAGAVDKILSAGIRRLNISLDTLNPNKFRYITGEDRLDSVWRGIQAAHRSGIHPIKINVVALKGINDDELVDIASLSFSHPFHIRFIEYMPIGSARDPVGDTMLVPEIRNRLSSLGPLLPVENRVYDGPAQRYRLEGAAGEIGFISALSSHFCSRCNRLRLTADGQLRPCLLSDHQEDLKGPLRQGRSDEELAKIFFRTVGKKPFEHSVHPHGPATIFTQMCSIGG